MAIVFLEMSLKRRKRVISFLLEKIVDLCEQMYFFFPLKANA